MSGWLSGYRDGHRDGRNAARHRNDELSLLLRGMARRVGEFRSLAGLFAASVPAVPETVEPPTGMATCGHCPAKPAVMVHIQRGCPVHDGPDAYWESMDKSDDLRDHDGPAARSLPTEETRTDG